MNVLRSVLLSLILYATNNTTVWGQDDPYRAEVGFQTGMNVYSGDVNTIATRGIYAKNLKNITPDFGTVFRYRLSQRVAVKLAYDFTRVKGNYQYADASQVLTATLNNPIHAVDLCGEFNFFDLNNNPHKRFSKRFSPFIFAGIGSMLTPAYKRPATNSFFTATIPFGAGVKIKIGERWNLNALFSNRWIMGDHLEGIPAFDNPEPKTRNNAMNHDLLSGINIAFTFDFWQRDCDCMQPASHRSAKPKAHKSVRPKKSSTKRK